MIVSEYIPIDVKSYVTAENYDKVLYQLKAANEKIYELEQQGRNLDQFGKELDCIKAEREELFHRLEKAEANNREMRAKVEWYKGQIEAYQYCMNCHR